MTIYIPDYDNLTYSTIHFETIANLDALTRELDELYDEWYDNLWDVEEALANFH